jgi:hypothetical protein
VSKALSAKLNYQSGVSLNGLPLPLLSARMVKARVCLLDYVSRQLPKLRLKRRGSNWFGICPLHEERHPSFAIRSDKELWFCFGCRRGGDVFDFEMVRTGCSFPEAVRAVARHAGLLSDCAAGNADLFYGRAFPKGRGPEARADDCSSRSPRGRSPLVVVPGVQGAEPPRACGDLRSPGVTKDTWSNQLRRLRLECTTCGWSIEGEDILVLADGFEAHVKVCERWAIRSRAGAHA